MTKIEPMFAYQGGKSKIAGKVLDFVLEGKEAKDRFAFVDICCGGGSVSIEMLNRGKLSEQIYMFDSGAIGAFWQQVSEGIFDTDWFEHLYSQIPSDVKQIQSFMQELSKIEYDYVGEQVPAYLLLQASSFGGKQIFDEGTHFSNTSFRGYWEPTETSSRRSPVNPMMPMPSTLKKRLYAILEEMQGIRACHTYAEYIDFNKIKSEYEEGVVYIDPPYSNTTKYKDTIDLDLIISNAKSVGYSVFVSEYKPLSNSYIEISKTNKGGISGNSSKQMTEYLSKM